MTPDELSRKIRKLPEFPSITADFELALKRRGAWGKKPVWYTSQKQHWLGWLSEYHGQGAYGRKYQDGSAEFAYNHIVCPPVVLWLGEAAGVPKARVIKAKQAALAAASVLAAQSAAIRRTIPWALIEKRLNK
jgi:hypothetical protein